MQITYTATIYHAGPLVALEVIRTCDGHAARGLFASRFMNVKDCFEIIRVLAGDGHYVRLVVDLTGPQFEAQTREWPAWAGDMPRFVLPQIVETLDGGPGEPASRDELIHALEEAYVELGKDRRYEISTLRLDIIRTALRNSGIKL